MRWWVGEGFGLARGCILYCFTAVHGWRVGRWVDVSVGPWVGGSVGWWMWVVVEILFLFYPLFPLPLVPRRTSR